MNTYFNKGSNVVVAGAPVSSELTLRLGRHGGGTGGRSRVSIQFLGVCIVRTLLEESRIRLVRYVDVEYGESRIGCTWKGFVEGLNLIRRCTSCENGDVLVKSFPSYSLAICSGASPLAGCSPRKFGSRDWKEVEHADGIALGSTRTKHSSELTFCTFLSLATCSGAFPLTGRSPRLLVFRRIWKESADVSAFGSTSTKDSPELTLLTFSLWTGVGGVMALHMVI
jgi:hypothetical protein